MAFHSQTLRIARALTRELHPTVVRSRIPCSNPHPKGIHNGISSPARSGFLSRQSCFRAFSAKPEEPAEPQSQSSQGEAQTPLPPTDGDAADDETAPEEEHGDDKEALTKLQTEVQELKDSLLRSLAEQENTRRIARRDVANAKSYAISSFAKSLLDASDNLSRAVDAVPEELRSDRDNHPVLVNLFEGIKMTDEGLTKAFAKNGLTKFGVKGEKFDPNLHEALFEYPDPEGEPGDVGQVMKVGFMLNERVLRPAEVGVVKNP